jgi:ATP/maltotriose-dependent transcriptional regulator MalT
MAMTFLLPDSIDSGEFYGGFSSGQGTVAEDRAASTHEVHILREKLTVPKFDALIGRPRLSETLERSLTTFGATMLCGRAGSGKSALAADFCERYSQVAWLTVDGGDAEWKNFAAYFAAAVSRDRKLKPREKGPECNPTAMAEFLGSVLEGHSGGDPMLLVLDDIHRIFDAEWFCEFFNLLLYSLPENVQLLLLCRSKPPNPLWRLRSKQMLNVVDEKLLAFNQSETTLFFASLGLPEPTAKRAWKESFGRISKLIQIAIRDARENGGTAA